MVDSVGLKWSGYIFKYLARSNLFACTRGRSNKQNQYNARAVHFESTIIHGNYCVRAIFTEINK